MHKVIRVGDNQRLNRKIEKCDKVQLKTNIIEWEKTEQNLKEVIFENKRIGQKTWSIDVFDLLLEILNALPKQNPYDHSM